MEAHEAFERFEHSQHADGGLTSQAALLVAVLAAFLAIATFKANEAVKDAIQTQTKVADTHAQYQTQLGRQIELQLNNATLNAIATTSSQAKTLSAAADKLGKTADELEPEVKHLQQEAKAQSQETNDANHQHLLFELAEVGLQIGIVLASVAIIARRRWLLAGSALAGTAGLVVLIVGFAA